jgi:hypothetical protein
VIDELADQAVTLAQLQQAVTIAQLPDAMPKEIGGATSTG